jgi:hypothetical protein
LLPHILPTLVLVSCIGHALLNMGVECQSVVGEVYFGLKDFVDECAEACRGSSGCKYFIYGTGSKTKRCYMEGVTSDSCGPDGYEIDEYDFYKLLGVTSQANCDVDSSVCSSALSGKLACATPASGFYIPQNSDVSTACTSQANCDVDSSVCSSVLAGKLACATPAPAPPEQEQGQNTEEGSAVEGFVTALPQSEIDALHELYNMTDGPNWRGTTAKTSTATWSGCPQFTSNDPCSSPCVTCKLFPRNGVELTVEQLFLSDQNLVGALPLNFFGDLKNLVYVYLSRNNLSGSIPDSIGKLHRVNELGLHNNNFSGVIPTAFSELAKLNYLSLERNRRSNRLADVSTSLPLIFPKTTSPDRSQRECANCPSWCTSTFQGTRLLASRLLGCAQHGSCFT